MLVATVLRSSRRPDGSSGTTACVHAASTLASRDRLGDSCRAQRRALLNNARDKAVRCEQKGVMLCM
jgi:hypothetical protein